MADQHDTVITEQARLQRARLASALLSGRLEERRVVNDYSKRLTGAIILAAIVCAVCVGISFVASILGASPESGAAAAVIVGGHLR